MMVPVDVMEQMREAFSAEALDLLIELDSAPCCFWKRSRTIRRW